MGRQRMQVMGLGAPGIPLRRRTLPVRTAVTSWPLTQANEAPACRRDGGLDGAAVLDLAAGRQD